MTIDNADFSLENVSADDGKREILYLSENLVVIVVIGGGIFQQFLQFFKRFMADVRLQQKPVYSMVNGIVYTVDNPL